VTEWLDSTQIDTVQSQQYQDNKQNQGHLSMIYLARQGELLAQFCLSDHLRPEALSVIQALKAQNIKVSLLSGDNQTAVDAVAQQLQIEHAIGTLLPADKLEKIRQWQAQGEVVAMVGDGVNDAPVLAGANVSLAMGNGSQLAQASADMIILSESLKQLPAALTLSRKMQSVIYQNFSWAIFYNLLAIPLAAMGWILPWMAAIGMSISSVLVVLNALRLRDI
jgi:Cu2+-exporting ATPase